MNRFSFKDFYPDVFLISAFMKTRPVFFGFFHIQIFLYDLADLPAGVHV